MGILVVGELHTCSPDWPDLHLSNWYLPKLGVGAGSGMGKDVSRVGSEPKARAEEQVDLSPLPLSDVTSSHTLLSSLSNILRDTGQGGGMLSHNFLALFLKIKIKKCVKELCMHMFLCGSMYHIVCRCLLSADEVIGFPRTGVIGGCESLK